MLKMVGAICVMTGSLGCGLIYVQNQRHKIMYAGLWENIMQMFLSEISYKKQSLYLAVYEIAERIGGREGECFKRIYERYQRYEGESFSLLWEEEWNWYFKERRMQEAEKKLIQEFAEVSGYEDERIQMKLVEEQREKWKDLKISIRKGQQEREKIVWTVSWCAGIVLILILI